MKRLVLLVALAAFLASCGSSDVSGSGDSGIEGRVTIGPTCPVVQENSPCPDQPFQARIDVLRDGDVVTSFKSGEDGNFRVPLEPGTYTLQGVSPGEGVPPYATPVDVIVSAGAFTQVDIVFDSGIR